MIYSYTDPNGTTQTHESAKPKTHAVLIGRTVQDLLDLYANPAARFYYSPDKDQRTAELAAMTDHSAVIQWDIMRDAATLKSAETARKGFQRDADKGAGIGYTTVATVELNTKEEAK